MLYLGQLLARLEAMLSVASRHELCPPSEVLSNEPEPFVVSGPAMIARVGLRYPFCGHIALKSSVAPALVHLATATCGPGTVFSNVSGTDCDISGYSLPVTPLQVSSALELRSRDYQPVHDSDSDDTLSQPGSNDDTPASDDHKSSPLPFEYAGFGLSILDQIDYDAVERAIAESSLDMPSVPNHPTSTNESSWSDLISAGDATATSASDNVDLEPLWPYPLDVSDTQSGEGHVDLSSIIDDEPNVVTLEEPHGNEIYTLCGKLGQGTFGRVMLATTANGKPVAVKVIHKHSIYQHAGGRDTVVKEQEILKKITLSGKPFLANLLSSWQDDANVYLVMRLYYQSFDVFKSSIDFMSMTPLLKLYVAELAAALSNLHGLRIVHRDIKPGNILVGEDGHIAFADFGLSWTPKREKFNFHKGRVWNSVGTTVYMAPELLTLGPHGCYGAPTDIWSLGLIIYEMALGHSLPYFTCDSEEQSVERILNEELDFTLVDAIDPALGDLLRRMLTRDPCLRIRAEKLQTHPYFWDIVFEDLHNGLYTAIHPDFPQPKPTTDISFDTYHLGLEKPSRYKGFWDDVSGKLLDSPDLVEQRAIDEANPDCFNFVCPEENRCNALYGWPSDVLAAIPGSSTSPHIYLTF